MKVQVSYNKAQLIALIQEDILNKLGVHVAKKDLEVHVMSKQNYRVTEWEKGDLKCEVEVNV